MFSYQAWNACARWVAEGVVLFQLFLTSWSSNTTSHGAAACAARSAGSVRCWA
jgi:hypothetical protein